MDSYLRPCVVRVGEEPSARLAVDTWRQPGCGAYFCTHAHADHTVGLSDCWSDGPLFCSEATRTLLLLKWPRLARLVTALQFDETVRLRARGPSPRQAARSLGGALRACVRAVHRRCFTWATPW